MAAGLGARGLEQKILENYAAKKMYTKSLWNEEAEAVSLCKAWLEVSPYKEELGLVRERMHDGAESDQGGWSGRLVGTDVE